MNRNLNSWAVPRRVTVTIAISLLGPYHKELKTGIQIFVHKGLDNVIHNSQGWIQLMCPSMDKWINKMCYRHAMDYYSVLRSSYLLHK